MAGIMWALASKVMDSRIRYITLAIDKAIDFFNWGNPCLVGKRVLISTGKQAQPELANALKFRH
jgi:hypothetical protein